MYSYLDCIIITGHLYHTLWNSNRRPASEPGTRYRERELSVALEPDRDGADAPADSISRDGCHGGGELGRKEAGRQSIATIPVIWVCGGHRMAHATAAAAAAAAAADSECFRGMHSTYKHAYTIGDRMPSARGSLQGGRAGKARQDAGGPNGGGSTRTFREQEEET